MLKATAPTQQDYKETRLNAQAQHDAAGLGPPASQQVIRGNWAKGEPAQASPTAPRSDYWTFATHAVQGYQQQRAELVKKLTELADGFVGNIEARSQMLVDAIAVIDAKIDALSNRAQP